MCLEDFIETVAVVLRQRHCSSRTTPDRQTTIWLARDGPEMFANLICEFEVMVSGKTKSVKLKIFRRNIRLRQQGFIYCISGRQHVRDVDVISGDDPSLQIVNRETLP